jgi:hypothetical protein
MNDEERLARFQAALLEILAQPLDTEGLARCLAADPDCEPYREYLATFEPRMLEVAAALVKKWGRRGGSRSDPTAPG